ncbi:MAG: DUF222 domain-containing protein [Chloroflexi bacterium]|nr:MAG: DUF222 domain-containing protein [Chloroflexota bacterium]
MATATAILPSPLPAWALLIDRGLRMAEDEDIRCAGALGDHVELLSRFADRHQAEAARRLCEFEQRRGPAADGACSTVAWLTARCRMSPGRAADMVCVSRRLPELPETARALRDGEIGYQHASVMAHTASDVGAEAVREAERDLVPAAGALGVREFGHLARRFRECVDPDGSLADANHDHERRRLHLSETLGGCWRLDGWLDREGGALLKTALNPLMKPVPDDRRTGSQRCADALLELCRRQLDAGTLPLVGGQRPHLYVTVPVETLRGEPGSPGGELRWSGPIVGELARRLACDAVRTEITVGPCGEPLAVGRPSRTIPAHLRRLLIARDGGCRGPGCTRPPDWCEGHHIRPLERGGPTVLENLLLLCRFHHTLLHEGGWRLVRVSETGFEFVPPDARSP